MPINVMLRWLDATTELRQQKRANEANDKWSRLLADDGDPDAAVRMHRQTRDIGVGALGVQVLRISLHPGIKPTRHDLSAAPRGKQRVPRERPGICRTKWHSQKRQRQHHRPGKERAVAWNGTARQRTNNAR